MSEHLSIDTRTGKVKGTSSNTGTAGKPIDFNDVFVTGLNGGGGGGTNAFGVITVGATSIIADAAPDTLTLIAGANVTLTPNALTDSLTIAASGGGGTSMSSVIAQTAHGFIVGNIVRYTGTAYAKAQADTAANAEVVGLVSAVADANNFTLTTGGAVTGLSGLTAGSVYFLSTSTAGLLTTTGPSVTDQVSKPLLVATTATTGYFFNWRGSIVGSGAVGGGGGGGTPGGLTTQLQYNNAGAFGGATNVTTDGTSLIIKGATADSVSIASNQDDITLRNTVANTATYFRVMPNGSVANFPSAFTFYGTDRVADPSNYERMFIYGKGTADSYYVLGTDAAGTGIRRPLLITSDGSSTQMLFSTTGDVSVGTSISGPGTVPVGGTTNQVLSKTSNANYAVGWATPAGGGTVTSITATSPVVVTPTPLTGTGIFSLDKTVDLAMTAAQTTTVTDAGTANIVDILKLDHESSATPLANYGTGLLFRAKDNATANVDAGRIAVGWQTATHSTRSGYMDFQLGSSSAPASSMRLYQTASGVGALTVGSTVDLSANAGIINAHGGFWIGGAAPTSGKILQSNASAFIQSTMGLPTGTATSRKILVSDGTNWAASTETWAVPGTSGNVLTSNGTNWLSSAPTGGGVTSITGTSPIIVSPTTGAAVASLDKTVDLAMTAAQTVTVLDAAAGVTPSLILSHNSTGTPSTSFGPGILFKAEDSTTDNTSIGQIQFYWTNVTHNSNVSKIGFMLTNGGLSLGEKATLTGAGIFDVVSGGGFTIGATATTGKILQGDGTKFASSTPTWPTAASTLNKVVKSDGTNLVMSTETYAVPGTAGQVLRSNATNWLSAALNFSDLTGNYTLAQGPTETASTLLGRGAGAGNGIPQEITLGTNLSMSGTTLNATGGGGGTPGGTDTLMQYNNAGAFGACPTLAYNNSTVVLTMIGGTKLNLIDNTDNTKKANFDVSNIATATTRTVNIPNANSTTVQADTGAANNFLTAVSAQGVISKAQPTPTNVGLGNVTNAAQTLASVVPNTLPAAGQLLIGNAGATAYAPVTMGTDATITSAGALTIANNAVTLGKMATMATDSILGRATAATGNVEVLASLPFAYTGDVTRAADSNVTVLANIPDLTPAVGSILFTNIAAPVAPAATKDKVWFDTTDQRLHEKNTVGTIGTTVVADTGAASNFLTAISAAGVISKAQPAFSNLTGSATAAQMPAFTGDVTSVAGATANTLVNIPLTTTIAGVAGTRGDVLYYGASGWAKLAAGTSGNQLTTNGAGADPTWAAPGSGGSGSPGGSTLQLQYNNAGAFGGMSGTSWDDTNCSLTLTGATVTTSKPIFDLAQTWNASGIVFTGLKVNVTNTASAAGSALADFQTGTVSQTKIRHDGFIDIKTGIGIPSVGSYVYDAGDGYLTILAGGSGLKFVQTGNYFTNQGSTFIAANNSQYGWQAAGQPAISALDTALARNAAGVVEINNGTAGTYRDLRARIINVSNAIQLNGVSLGSDYYFSNTASVTPAAVDLYLTASAITVPAGGFAARGQYHCVFDVVKSAGTGAIVLTVRIGTLGTTGDTSRMTFTFGAGTSVADTGTFEVFVNWRSVGSGTSAVIAGFCRAQHNLATTGLFNNAAVWTIVGTVSGGFDSSAATTIGLSFNGSTAFAGTITTIQSTLVQ